VSESSGWQPQRTAAARNEAKLLDAARALLRDPEADFEMRDVADAAGVGVGTLYRRFGNRAGLLSAVVGEDERDLQQRMVSGPPPLGPGGPAAQRLTAFLTELVALTDRNLDALVVTEATDGGRLKVPSYHGWRLHVITLIREARPGVTAKDAGWLADVLLSTVDARVYAFQRRELKMSQRWITEHVVALAGALVD
jgi:AcrR family transcriptional regulator